MERGGAGHRLFFFGLLFLPQQDEGIDGESAACGNPGGGQAEKQHGDGDADEHDGIFGRGLIDDVGEHPCGEQAQRQAGHGADGEQAEGTPERSAQNLPASRAEGHANAEFAEAAADHVGGHAEDAGDGQHGAEQAEGPEGHGGDTRGEEGAVHLFIPGSDGERQAGIQSVQRGVDGARNLRGIAVGADHERGAAVGVLEEREEHGRLLIFREGAVLTVFDHADDLRAVAAPELEVAADGFVDRAKDLDREGAVDKGDGGGSLLVVHGEIAARQEPCSRGVEISGGNIVVHGVGSIVGGPVVGGVVGVDEGVASAQVEGNLIDGARGGDAGNGGKRFNHALLHLLDAIAGVAGHVQVGGRHGDVLGIEAEVAVQRTDEAAHRDKRGGDEHRADGDLGDEQDVAHAEAPHAGGVAHAGANGLPGIGAQDLPDGHHAEEQSAEQGEEQSDGVGAEVGVYGHVDGNVGNGLPGAEEVQYDYAAGEPDDSADEGDEDGLGEQLAEDEAAPGAQRQAQRYFFGALGGAGGKQAAQVSAGGQQNEAGEEHEAGHEGARGSAEHIADEARAREGELYAIIRGGIGFCEPCADGIEICGCLRGGDAWLEAAEDERRVIAALLELVVALHDGLLDERHPEGGGKEQLCAAKGGRRHADDGEGVLVDLYGAAHDVGVAMEVTAPVRVAEHHVGRAVEAFFIGGMEEAAEIRMHAEHIEVVAGGEVRPCRGGIAAGIDADRTDDFVGDEALEGVVAIAQVEVVGVRVRRVLEALHGV